MLYMSTNSELVCMLLSLRRAYSVDDTRMNEYGTMVE